MLTMDMMADLTPGGENVHKIDNNGYDNGKQVILKFKNFISSPWENEYIDGRA